MVVIASESFSNSTSCLELLRRGLEEEDNVQGFKVKLVAY